MSVTENERDAQAAGLRRPYARNLHPLHEAALRLAEFRPGRKGGRSKDLVALLLSHGARAWRHAQPQAEIHLHVASQSGRYPVILRLR